MSLNEAEKKFVDGLLAQHHETQLYCGKHGVLTKKKKTAKEKILLIGSNRIYVIKTLKPAVKGEIHLWDVEEVSSPNGKEVTIKGRGKDPVVIALTGLLDMRCNEIIHTIYSNFKLTFPGMPVNYFPKFFVAPEDRIGKNSVSEDDIGPCGGFARTYTCICDYLNIPVCEDICWDINIIYPLNNIDRFDLSDLSLRKAQLTGGDMKAMMFALRHNEYFVCLQAQNAKLSDALGFVAEMIQYPSIDMHMITARYNSYLERLIIPNVGMSKEVLAHIANSIASNPHCNLQHIDISGNPLEDKAVAALGSALSTLKRGLVTLNVAKTCTKGGIVSLVKFLESNQAICTTLENFSVAGIKLDGDAGKDLGSFIGRTQSLKRLNVSGTGVNYHHLNMKKLENMIFLDASGNKLPGGKDNTHLELAQFCANCPNLEELILSNCQLSPDVVRSLFGGSNLLSRLKMLDLNDNELGDAGLVALVETFGTKCHIKTLKLDRNFSKPTKQRGQAVLLLSEYIKSDACTIAHLHICGGGAGKFAMKDDILPLVFATMTNKSIKLLDISGHHIGNPLGLALCKVLSVNRVLENLHIDDNSMTHIGFKVLKLGVDRSPTLKKFPYPVMDATNCPEHQKTYAVLNKIQHKVTRNAFGKGDFVERGVMPSYTKSGSLTRVSSQTKPTRIPKRTYSIDTVRASHLFSGPPVLHFADE